MGKLFYIMGKSASGKDTLFKILKEHFPDMKTITMYTTRPIRENEADGEEYYFVTRERRRELEEEGKVIECRTYQTIAGPWDYFTVDDGQIDFEKDSYLMLGTLESYEKLRAYFGAEALCPIYIDLDEGVRLKRAIARERNQQKPNYREVCRRFLADDADFAEENLERLEITKRYFNEDLETCLHSIETDIRKILEN